MTDRSNPEPILGLEDMCAGAYARAPVALDAYRARSWWERGQLALLYPDGIPNVVIEAVDLAESVRSAWQSEGQRQRMPKGGSDG